MNEWPLIITKDDPGITLDSYLWFKRREILKEISTEDRNWLEDYLDDLRGKVIVYPYEKAITQVLFLPVPDTTWQEVSPDVFSTLKSDRGEGMLGSSGK